MKYPHIVASLPMLQYGVAPLMDMDAFRSSCTQLDAADALELEHVVQGEWAACHSAFVAQWVDRDVQLRDAAVRFRAEKAGAEAGTYMRSFKGFDVSVEKAVEEAFGKSDPMEREKVLNRCRWRILDELTLPDAFGLTAILAYAIKLKIALREASLDEKSGRECLEELIVNNLKDEGSMAKFLED